MEICRVLQKQKIKNEMIDEAIKSILEIDIEIVIPENYIFIKAYDSIREYQLDIGDAFHLAIAIENEAILVTWDEKLLKKSRKIIIAKTPREIIFNDME